MSSPVRVTVSAKPPAVTLLLGNREPFVLRNANDVLLLHLTLGEALEVFRESSADDAGG